MNPWQMIAAQGSPSFQDIQAEEASQGVPGTVNLWAGVPDASQVSDPTGAPSVRGKVMKFEGHWEKVPGGKRYVRDKIWYEDAKS
jgi:hypothetical protein